MNEREYSAGADPEMKNDAGLSTVGNMQASA
jgi:hypothetical protein